MKLQVQRKRNNGKATVGELYINGAFECHTLEDEHRDIKVMAETRIPAGTYQIRLRTVGMHHIKYKEKFAFHKGMLQLQNVPGFEFILIHIGNTEKDTAGCLLVGKTESNYTLQQSTAAYTDMYKKVLAAIEAKEPVFIEIIDEK